MDAGIRLWSRCALISALSSTGEQTTIATGEKFEEIVDDLALRPKGRRGERS